MKKGTNRHWHPEGSQVRIEIRLRLVQKLRKRVDTTLPPFLAPLFLVKITLLAEGPCSEVLYPPRSDTPGKTLKFLLSLRDMGLPSRPVTRKLICTNLTEK